MEELKQKWDLIIQTLKEDYDITDMSFRTWIKPIQVYSVVGDKITLLIPENNNDSDGKGLSYNMRVGYIERKYLAAITLTIAEIMGREYDVTLMSSIDKEKIDKKQKQKDTSASKNNNIQNLNPNYTFVGASCLKNNPFSSVQLKPGNNVLPKNAYSVSVRVESKKNGHFYTINIHIPQNSPY